MAARTRPVRGHDVIVVGAGLAGCTLAARLSEDPVRRVLLLEGRWRLRGVAGTPPAEMVSDFAEN